MAGLSRSSVSWEESFSSTSEDPPYSPSSEKNSETGDDSEGEGPSGESRREEAGVTMESEPPKKKSRKRVRHPEHWKQSKRKQRRNSGKTYTSTSGSTVRAE